jgi:predicted TPR repeat methyltransferase
MQWMTAPNSNRLTATATLAGLLMLATLVLYWPATGHEFTHFDDLTYYVQNAQVQAGLGWDGLVWAFQTGTASNWHPLTWLSLMLDADLASGPTDAWTPHFTNVLLHALDCGLLFALLRRATGAKWRSLLVAGLFAVHPLNVESVAWVAERKSLLSLFFSLLALLAYVQSVTRARCQVTSARKIMSPVTPHSSLFYWLALGAFALALMSKPMAVTLPFVLLLLDGWPLGRISDCGLRSAEWKRLVGEKWAFFLLSALACAVTFLVQQHGNAVQSEAHFPLAGRLENIFVSYTRYLGKTVWPVDLAVFYPHPGHWPLLQTGLCAALVGLLSAGAVWRARQQPYLVTGWFWFLGTLVPVIGLVQAGTQAMADRYAYLPLIGLFLAVVWGGFDGLKRLQVPPAAMFALAGMILIASAVMARRQLNFWQNDGTLFGHALAVTEKNVPAEITYGVYLEKINQPAEAMQHYRAALAIDPNEKNAHFDLANLLDDAGQPEAAIQEYRAASRSDPDYYPANYNLALLLERLGRRDEAIAEYQAALRIKPDLQAAKQHLQGLGVAVN